jgi:hypothetical protein
MYNGSVALMLIFEPATSDQHGPIPLARIGNPQLALLVANAALSDTEERALGAVAK